MHVLLPQNNILCYYLGYSWLVDYYKHLWFIISNYQIGTSATRIDVSGGKMIYFILLSMTYLL